MPSTLIAAIASLSTGLLGQTGAKTEKIAWYSTMDSAWAEAERTGRPIFMIAARPCFRDVPGFW